jgi:hypothetical protein
MRAITALVIVVTLSGCATCQEHPAFCAVGAAVVAGSIAATIEVNRHDDDVGSRGFTAHNGIVCSRPGECSK